MSHLDVLFSEVERLCRSSSHCIWRATSMEHRSITCWRIAGQVWMPYSLYKKLYKKLGDVAEELINGVGGAEIFWPREWLLWSWLLGVKHWLLTCSLPRYEVVILLFSGVIRCMTSNVCIFELTLVSCLLGWWSNWGSPCIHIGSYGYGQWCSFAWGPGMLVWIFWQE